MREEKEDHFKEINGKVVEFGYGLKKESIAPNYIPGLGHVSVEEEVISIPETIEEEKIWEEEVSCPGCGFLYKRTVDEIIEDLNYFVYWDFDQLKGHLDKVQEKWKKKRV